MPQATSTGGKLQELKDCYIDIPGAKKITFDNLPEISDSKSASYTDETIVGRTTPLKAYSHSDNRTINIKINLFNTSSNGGSAQEDTSGNLSILRAIQSAVYPRDGSGGSPYLPPPVCKIKCGKLLDSNDLCVILKSYSVDFPTDVSWDESTFIPVKFSINTSWEVVYKTSELPGQNKIVNG